jgi:murein DD-endopeptidase MepM/ murein hydrolase activator NlpD
MKKWQQQKILSRFMVFLLGLTIVSAMAVLPDFKDVTAVELNPNPLTPTSTTSTTNRWSSASFPVENFQAYTSPFGYRPSPTGGGRWEFHSGLDIAAPQGSYIRNWWAGKVIKVGDDGRCGTHIILKSGQWQHTYCHMIGQVETINGRRYLVDRPGGIQIPEGQNVPTGYRIGRVGMTGRTTGPHLHWGLKFSNKHVDPAVILREMFSEQQVASRPQSNFKPPKSQVIIEESKFINNSGGN